MSSASRKPTPVEVGAATLRMARKSGQRWVSLNGFNGGRMLMDIRVRIANLLNPAGAERPAWQVLGHRDPAHNGKEI